MIRELFVQMWKILPGLTSLHEFFEVNSEVNYYFGVSCSEQKFPGASS